MLKTISNLSPITCSVLGSTSRPSQGKILQTLGVTWKFISFYKSSSVKVKLKCSHGIGRAQS